MKTFNRIAIVILLCFTFFSCEQQSLTVTKEPYKNLDEFFEKNGAPIQIFSINAEQGGSITGTRGTNITFSPHSFKHANGTLATDVVTISLREVCDKADMVLSRIPTMCNGAPLKSGGMFALHAWQGTEELQMANGKTYTASMPATNPDGNMRAYIGGADSVNIINWTPADTTWIADTTIYNQYNYYGNIFTDASDYVLTSSWLGWWNCDSPIPQTVSDEITLTSVNYISGFNTDLFILLEGNTAVEPYSYPPGTFVYAYAPEGYSATAVVIGLKDSILYSAFVPFTVSNSEVVKYTLQQTTTDEFKTALDALQ